MKRTHTTAGATLVLTVLMVMLLLAGILVVTAQLAVNARRSAADQDATAQAQYVAESGVARSQARLNLVSDLLSTDMSVPANTLSSKVLTDVLNLCGLATLPTPITNQTLCSSAAPGGLLASVSNLVGSTRLQLFADFVQASSLESRGYPLSGTTTAQGFWAETFSGSSLSATAGSGTFNTQVGVNISKVKYLGPDTYQIKFTLPDVSSTGTTSTAAKRSLKVAAVNTEYTFNINRGSFAQYALFTNHHAVSSAAEGACVTNPACARITFTSNTLFSGPVHSNQGQMFGGQPYFGGPVTSAGCPAGHIASSSGVEYCDVAATPGAYSAVGNGSRFTSLATMSPNSGAPQLVGCANTATPCTAANTTTSTPQFLGGVNWNAAFVPLPKNANDQAGQAAAGGLSLQGTVNSLNLTASAGPVVLPGLSNQPVQLISYSQTLSGTTASTELAVTADKQVFVKVGSAWVAAVQVNGVYVPTTSPLATGVTAVPFNGVIYALNGISSLTGGTPRTAPTDPATAGPALASFSQITLAASGSIHIKSDLKYADPPCSGSNSSAGGSFVAAPCPNTQSKNILGVYSAGGDVLIDSQALYPGNGVGKDVNIHAVLMSSTGKVAVDGYDQGTADASVYGKVHLMGGIIENYYGAFGITDGHGFGRDFVYDARTSDGLAPPSFPTQGAWSVTLPTALKLNSSTQIQQAAP